MRIINVPFRVALLFGKAGDGGDHKGSHTP
jgi:hypothetical protein